MSNDPRFPRKVATATGMSTRTAVKTAVALFAIGGIAFALTAVISGKDKVRISFNPIEESRIISIPASNNGEYVLMGNVLFDRTRDRRGSADILVRDLEFKFNAFNGGDESLIEGGEAALQSVCLSRPATPNDCIAESGLHPVYTRSGKLRSYNATLSSLDGIIIPPQETEADIETYNLYFKVESVGNNNLGSFRFSVDKKASNIFSRILVENGELQGKAKMSTNVRGRVELVR